MEVNIDGYSFNEKDLLGEGAFGKVYRGKHEDRKKDIAVKKVHLPAEAYRNDDEIMKYIEGERKALEQLNHPNVVKLYYAKKEKDSILFIMELCTCDLDSYFEKAKSVSLELRLDMMSQIALAIQYMHHKKPEPFAHRDLKPQNILLTITGDEVVVKVTDFGLARQMKDDISKVDATVCGTKYYQAPEVWPDMEGNVQYHIGVDIFALGVLYLAILQGSPGKYLNPTKVGQHGTLPLGHWMSKKNDCGERVQPDNLISINVGDDRMNHQLKDLIQGMLQQNPKERIKCNDVVTKLQQVKDLRLQIIQIAYISLEQECAKQRRYIESALSGWINKECHIQIMCHTVQEELEDCFKTMLLQLQSPAYLEEEKSTIYLQKFVEEQKLWNTEPEKREQWKTDMLTSYKEGIKSDTSLLKKLLNKMREQKIAALEQGDQQHHYKGEIMKYAMGLANMLRRENLPDYELKKRFECKWTIWTEEIRHLERKKSRRPILSILHDILVEMFKDAGENKYLSAAREKHERSTTALNIPTLVEEDVAPKDKPLFTSNKGWLIKNLAKCNETLKKIIMIRHVVDGIVDQDSIVKFNRSHGEKVLQSILDRFAEVKRDGEAMFEFKPSVKAKVCLSVCDYAAEEFEKMNEEYERLHGINAEMETYKKNVLNVFQDTVKQSTTETNAVEYMCAAIRPNIEEIVNKDVSRKVLDLILEDIGYTKSNLMLRIMESFVQPENSASNVNSLKLYVNDAYLCAERWVKCHAESSVVFEIGKCKAKYFKIAAEHVNNVIVCIRESAAEATKEYKTEIPSWICSFCEHAAKEVSITPFELQDLANYTITNFETFQQLLEKGLSELNIKIGEKLAEVTKESVEWNGPDPYTAATNILWGCREQCPFCGEPCKRTDADHEADHECVQHRPAAIKGAYCEESKMLDTITKGAFCEESKMLDTMTPGAYREEIEMLDTATKGAYCEECEMLDTMTCGMNVASDNHCNFVTRKDEFHPYKEYKKFYPKWNIDTAGDASEYWKWIFCAFEEQIQEWHPEYKLKIPKLWRSVTKEQALDSLRMYKPHH